MNVAGTLEVRAVNAVLHHARVGQDADQQTAGQTGEAVRVDHTQCVVDLGEGTTP